MGKSSQRKGRAGELELAKILERHGYQIDPGRANSFGAQPDITGLPGVHIEVKRAERLNLPAAFQQAKRDSMKFRDGVPAVFHRRNREAWLVTMELKDWLELYQHHKCQCGGHCNRQKTGGESD